MKTTGKKATITEGPAEASATPVRSAALPRFFRKTQPSAQPVRRVEVDLTESLLEELDAVAAELNLPREALVKALLRQALDQHYLALSARLSARQR